MASKKSPGVRQNEIEVIKLDNIIHVVFIDQIFGIPHFYIFVKSMMFLLNLPNFKSLQAWKITFFDVF